MPLDHLRVEIEQVGGVGPYLLTVSDGGTPHCVSVVVAWVDDDLVLGVGNRSRDNATAQREVSLLWPPATPDGYSLIVDATVVATRGAGRDDNEIRLRPHRAVLHRPAGAATTDSPASCGADCIPIVGTDEPVASPHPGATRARQAPGLGEGT